MKNYKCNDGKFLKNNFFYYISAGNFCISDLEFCSKSERTIDIKLFDIANNKKLLNILQLHYIDGYNSNQSFTYERRAKWFCGYLADFKLGDIGEHQYQKSLTNPVVRIIIEDVSIMDDVLNSINNKN